MIDHISFAVKNYDVSIRFYDETLSLLGYKREITLDISGTRAAGYGNGGPRPCLWVSGGGHKEEEVGKARGVHIAFIGPSVEAINTWYKKCLELGGKDNGVPGPRIHYHEKYYGAFVIDPNGWRIEACLHNYQS